MKKSILYALCLALWGTAHLHAQAPMTSAGDYTANFNGSSELPEGWSAENTTVGTYGNAYVIADDRARTGYGLFRSEKSYGEGYVVTPAVTGTVSFYYRAYNKNTAGGVKVYAYGEEGVGEEITEASVEWTSGFASTSWTQQSFSLDKGTRLAFQMNYAAIDDFVSELYTVSEGAALKVTDAEGDEPAVFDFGLAEAGAQTVFVLSNPGKVALDLTIAATAGLEVSPAAASIPAEGKVELTVTLKATTTDGKVTIAPAAASGLDPVVITVKGTVRDAGKMFIGFDEMPEEWRSVSVGEYDIDSYAWKVAGGYAATAAAGSVYAVALTTTEMSFSEGETLQFDARKGSVYYVEPSLTVQYSADGKEWTDAAEAFIDMTSEAWKTYKVTLPATAKFIRFNGWNVQIDNIYGGTLLPVAPRPKLEVVDIANGGSLSWGYADLPAGSEKTITVCNTGKAELKVTFSTTAGYTLSATSATIAAGGSFELTIGTPAGDGPGVLTITPAEGSGLDVYTINLMSYYKEPKAVMGIDKTSIALGKLTASKSETVTVSNSGDATLTATIVSDNGQFTVSPASLSVEPGESADVTVTYNYVEGTYGYATAVVTVTPNDGSAVKIEVSANAKNPNMWSEDFEEGIPAQWINNGWTVAKAAAEDNATQMAYAGLTESTSLITPRLLAKTDEDLEFEAYLPWSDEALVVYYSTDDMATWKEAVNHVAVEDKTYEHFTFTAPADGYYYFKFTGRYNYIDNLQGFQLALPEHLMAITGATIPARGDQFADYTACVRVMEMVGSEENAVARLVVDGKVVATAVQQTVMPSATAEFQLTYTPQEALTDVKAYIEVEYAGGILKSDEVTLTIAPALILDESVAATIDEGTYSVAQLSYSLKQGWNTICLPFQVNDLSVFGEGIEVYQFSGVTDDGLLTFTRTASLGIGSPYVIYAKEAAHTFTFQNVTVFNFTTTAGDSQHGNVTFHGTYAPMAAGELTGKVGLTNQGRLIPATETATIKGFRGYFEVAEGTEVKGISIDGQLADGIGIIRGGQRIQSESVYTLDGRRISKPAQKGVFIQNGKKVVVK